MKKKIQEIKDSVAREYGFVDFASIDAKVGKDSIKASMIDAIASTCLVEKYKTIRPPLGLVPESIHCHNRIKEIKAAISRYEDADLHVPKVWKVELNNSMDYLFSIGNPYFEIHMHSENLPADGEMVEWQTQDDKRINEWKQGIFSSGEDIFCIGFDETASYWNTADNVLRWRYLIPKQEIK